jgi:hypothetical protein
MVAVLYKLVTKAVEVAVEQVQLVSIGLTRMQMLDLVELVCSIR